jgi:hypothetical protein
MQVTIDVPEALYSELLGIANEQNISVPELILWYIESWYPEATGASK